MKPHYCDVVAWTMPHIVLFINGPIGAFLMILDDAHHLLTSVKAKLIPPAAAWGLPAAFFFAPVALDSFIIMLYKYR
jgi:hypothetical protein